MWKTFLKLKLITKSFELTMCHLNSNRITYLNLKNTVNSVYLDKLIE